MTADVRGCAVRRSDAWKQETVPSVERTGALRADEPSNPVADGALRAEPLSMEQFSARSPLIVRRGGCVNLPTWSASCQPSSPAPSFATPTAAVPGGDGERGEGAR